MRRGTTIGISGRIALVLLLAVVSAGPAEAKHRKKHHPAEPPATTAFDYYVLSLSWSPEHCAEPAGHGDSRQCASTRHFAFVLHGLWPQYASGYPESCSHTPLSSTVRNSMLDIMPSATLVEHEWTKHGTCSGLPPDEYFGTARTAFTGITIPPAYRDPTGSIVTDADSIKTAFRSANPNMSADDVAVLCKRKFLQEVRVCLDRDLHPRPCGHDVKDDCRSSVIIRPVK
jgi:ribonuclease T2